MTLDPSGSGALRQRPASPPRRKAPPGSADCHAHVFGAAARFPLAAERSYSPPPASTAEYLAMLATLGIDRAVIVQPSVYGFDNGATIGAVGAIGLERARAVVHVSPDMPDARLRELDGAGARGVRFITMSKGGAALEDLTAVAERIAPFGWHIQMYVPSATWVELEPIVRRLPVPVVMDHMGGIMADSAENDAGRLAVLRLLDTGRCWIKCSGYRSSVAGHPFADVAPIARLLVQHGPERCVWGTDWPHPNLPDHMPDDGALLDLLHDWEPDDAARRRILVDNPARLYGFGPLTGP